MKLPAVLATLIAQEDPAQRKQVSKAARIAYKAGLRDGRKAGFSEEDIGLIRWCVLTVSKGFVGEPAAQMAAAQLLTRIDGQDKRRHREETPALKSSEGAQP